MNTSKALLAVVAVLLAASALLFGAWALEESTSINSVVVQNSEGIFTIHLPEKEKATVLIQCNEGDFQQAFRKFADFLSLEEDPLSIPGGLKVLASIPSNVPEAMEPTQRSLIQILKRHSPSKIVLIGHSECLTYDVIAAWRNNLAQVRQQQDDDLAKAVTLLKTWFPDSAMEAYYAQKEGNNLIFNLWQPATEREGK